MAAPRRALAVRESAGAGQRPNHSTIATSISGMGPGRIEDLFAQVPLVCTEEGLLGGTHFAIDGCRMSSNASKEWSGKRSDLIRKRNKLRAADLPRRGADAPQRRALQGPRRGDGDQLPRRPGGVRPLPPALKVPEGSRQRTARQVRIFYRRGSGGLSHPMKAKIETPLGRGICSQRLGIVEPVFANIAAQKGLDRFTLRGRAKVNIQWKLYCIVHNLEKVAGKGRRWNRPTPWPARRRLAGRNPSIPYDR
ncbi:MAG TPA: transposase [Verrucomicrobiae bacterium]|nr:transposase [Verrucomicrobiae bacterium]